MLAFWSSLSVSDRRDIIGLLMVAIGVAGDVMRAFDFTKKLLGIKFNPTDFSFLDFRKKCLEITAAALIVVGLGLEVSAWPAHIKEVELLKQGNLELQMKMQPRVISAEHWSKFIKLSKGLSPIKIKVFAPVNDNEAYRYALQFRDMLDEAGLKPPANGK